MLVAALEQALGDRQDLLLDDALDERRLEVVVDDDDAVDLALGVQLADSVRDRLGVVVGGRSLKPIQACSTSYRRNRSVEAPFRPDTSQRTCTPSDRSRRSTAKTWRRIWALNAPASPRSPVSPSTAAVRISRR